MASKLSIPLPTWLCAAMLSCLVQASVAAPAGLVVGDEPLAVQAGADMLNQGGSAADAAAATFFTLAVTYPVVAGLGGGGLCLVREPAKETVESIDFLPRNVRSRGPLAVPGNVRGFALLHTLYGRKPWQSVVAKGERLATLGFPMSRTLALRLADTANIVRLDAGLAKVFMDESGSLRREGEVLRNAELGATLAAIRIGGPNAFYTGKVAASLMSYAARQNAAIAPDELANYAPGRALAHRAAIGEGSIFLPAARTGAGKLASAVLAELSDKPAVSRADVAASISHVLKGFGVSALPNDLGASAFAAVDAAGEAVACAVTMSGPFGSGRTAEASGVTLATAPATSSAGLSVAFLTPLLVIDGESGPLTLAGASAGGPEATATLLYDAIARASGHAVEAQEGARAAPLSVNVIICEGGSCSAMSNPGTHGIAAVVGQ